MCGRGVSAASRSSSSRGSNSRWVVPSVQPAAAVRCDGTAASRHPVLDTEEGNRALRTSPEKLKNSARQPASEGMNCYSATHANLGAQSRGRMAAKGFEVHPAHVFARG